MRDTHTEAERRYDATRLSRAPIEPAPIIVTPPLTPMVQVEQRSTDDQEPTTWTEFTCGAVLLSGPDSDGSPADLVIHGREITHTPITYRALAALHAELGALLAHPGVQAALPVGEAPDPTVPPCATTRVRVRAYTNDCSFPLLLSCQIGVALSEQRAALGLSEAQVWKLLIIAGEVIEAAFDLPAGVLPFDTNRAVDLAYRRGWKEAIADVSMFARSLVEQREMRTSLA